MCFDKKWLIRLTDILHRLKNLRKKQNDGKSLHCWNLYIQLIVRNYTCLRCIVSLFRHLTSSIMGTCFQSFLDLIAILSLEERLNNEKGFISFALNTRVLIFPIFNSHVKLWHFKLIFLLHSEPLGCREYIHSL